MLKVIGVSGKRRIPKAAVKPLMEYCKKQGEETGRSAAEIFKDYLELMNKYADYFFIESWPQTSDKQFGLSDADASFIKGGRNYGEKCERFTVVCLRRNISIEGFDAAGFDEDFRFYGNRECWDCVIPDAARLRKDIEHIEQAIKEYEEKMKQEQPSWIAMEMSEHYKRPDVVRRNKMMCVQLRLYEDMGGAKGKSCEVENKYRCPYGEESEQLIEDGGLVKFIWRQIEWYDHHWNPSNTFRPAIQDMKWYRYDESSIIDVTSYEDILKAIEDGRLEKIIKDHKKYMEETGRKHGR